VATTRADSGAILRKEPAETLQEALLSCSWWRLEGEGYRTSGLGVLAVAIPVKAREYSLANA